MTVALAPRLPRALLTDESWRMAGCAERCRVFWVTIGGRSYPERLVSHDPHHHEAYGEQVLARAYGGLHGLLVETGDLLIDGPRYEVRLHGQLVALTPREAGILFYLATRPEQLIRSHEIIHAVWGPEYVPERLPGRLSPRYAGDHMLRVVMARLRAKLGSARHLVETVPALGYRLRIVPSDGGREVAP